MKFTRKQSGTLFLKQKNGFTLIEVMVVIAIIGLLSSIILASLNSARLKSKDVAIKSEVKQMVNLLELEYNETGSYSNLLGGLRGTGGTYNGSSIYSCDVSNPYASSVGLNGFTGSAHGTNAITICNAVLSNMPNLPSGYPGFIVLGSLSSYGAVTSGVYSGRTYSVAAYLPGSNKYFCVGSNGLNSETSDGSGPGCYSSF